jgi:tetratricopeptide (TPR) repeat protein
LSDAVTSTKTLTLETLTDKAAKRAVTPAKLKRMLQGDLDNIVAKALKKDPQERYASVMVLAEDLRRYLDHQPVSARPDSLAYRTAKFVRRHRSMVAAGLLVVLAVSAGVAGTITQARRAEAQALQAQHERDNALRQLAYAESSNEFIGFLLQEGSDKPFTTRELLDRGEQLVERQFADDPAQRAHLRLMLAEQYGQAMNQHKAEALLLRAQADARKVSDLSLQIEIECQLAEQRGDNGSFDLALPMFDAAIARLRASPDIDRAVLARCLHGRSETTNESGDLKTALADAQAALGTLGAPRPDQRTQAILMRATLAMVQSKLDQSATAENEFRRAIAELEAMGRGRTEMASTLYNNLGVLLFDAGQTVRSAEAYRRALDVSRGLGGADPVLEGNYAKVLIELGRPRDAMPLTEHALTGAAAMVNKVVAPNIALQGALAWCQTNDVARCDALLAMARVGLTRTMPAGASIFGTLQMRQGQAALARGDRSEARDGLRRAVAIFDAAGARNRVGIFALTLLARTEQQLGDVDAAQAHAARAVTRAREALAGFAHSEWLGSALVAQGMVQQACGEAAAAQESWRAALAELQATVGDSAPATAEARRLLAGS